jgi:hypothetical protein
MRAGGLDAVIFARDRRLAPVRPSDRVLAEGAYQVDHLMSGWVTQPTMPTQDSRISHCRKDKGMAPARTLQVECATCSNSTSFIGQTESGVLYLDQEGIATLPQSIVVVCGCCDSTSLIRSWHDAALGTGRDDPWQRPAAGKEGEQPMRDCVA